MGSNSEWELFIRDMWGGMRALEWPQPPAAIERTGSNIPSMNVDSVSGIEVRPEVVPTGVGAPLGRRFDAKDPFPWKSLPAAGALVQKLPSDPQLPSKLSRVHDLEDGLDRSVVSGSHRVTYVPQWFTKVNRRQPSLLPMRGDDKGMAEVPRPEHFGAFYEWLEAARNARGLSKAELSRALKITKQTINKWYKGSEPGLFHMQKVSAWSGIDYPSLRLLAEGVPLPGTLKDKREKIAKRHPRLEQLLARLEPFAEDDEFLSDIENLIDGRLKRRLQVKRKQQQIS